MRPDQSDFCVGDWVVRPQRCRIERGSKAVRVKPKSMAVLECLARADGAVITRDALFAAVWPGAAVTDDVLTHSVVELRKAFDESARDARVIETIPKKGFRLVPPVRPLDNESSRGKRLLSTWSLAGIGASIILGIFAWQWLATTETIEPLTGAQTIAVLPFVDMSPDGDQAYFADGLSEELINRLTQLRGLQVTGRTSSFYFKGRNGDLREIGERLDVNHVLEGSVRKSGTQLRITAQLIDVSNGFHLWSRIFDRPFEDVFLIQEEIAESVAQALSIKLQVGELGTIVGGTDNIDAFDQVLLGIALYREFDADAMLQAAEHFERAITLDPEFALAWAYLADVYRNTRLVLSNEDYAVNREQSELALDRALQLAPTSPYILRTAARRYIDEGRWSKTESTLALAESSENQAASTNSSIRIEFYTKMGRVNDAIALTERVRRINPLDPSVTMYLGHLYSSQGLHEKALAELDRGYGLHGSLPLISVEGLLTALASDDEDEITRWLARAIEHEQPGAQNVHREMAQRLGDREIALSWLRNAFENSSVPDYYTVVWASYYHDIELALAALQRSPDPWAFWLGVTADIRERPEFKSLVRELGLEAYWREFGWADYCRPLGADDFECG